MSTVITCPNSLLAFFTSSIYMTVGAVDVLSELVGSLDRSKLSTIQFLRNRAVHITFKDTQSCDEAALNGIKYRGTPLRLQSVESKSCLVYLRDLSCEVPDAEARAFLRPFGEVHSINAHHHEAFPDILNGTRLVKKMLVEDVPSSVRLAGFDCRVWYRRQPVYSPMRRVPGHRVKDCPFNGVCRRCRQPGHAWGRAVPKKSSRDQGSCPPLLTRPFLLSQPLVLRTLIPVPPPLRPRC